MLVKYEGIDVIGKNPKVIAPHGCCAGYEPNFDDTRRGKQREKLSTTDITDTTHQTPNV
jgi:hypothetical protein